MKRQSGDGEIKGGERASNKVIKKKAKGTAAATKQVLVEEEEVAEERKAVEEGSPATVEWGCLWSGFEFDEEEMPWATSWIPFWEVDAYEALYGDVLWDYDIWDFKNNQNSNGLPLAAPSPFPCHD